MKKVITEFSSQANFSRLVPTPPLSKLLVSSNPIHIPVLLEDIVRESHIQPGSIYVDGTLGMGGHAQALFLQAQKQLTIVGFDKDLEAQKIARTVLAECGANPIIIHESFVNMKRELAKRDIESVDCILLDLGISSMQIDTDARGFSFQKDHPLHMNMNQEGDLLAWDIVNTWSEESLADIIFGFGEERYARKIAKAIVVARKIAKIDTTLQLVDVIKSATPFAYHRGKIHPATRTFQALRIAVNSELTELETVIPDAISLLKTGGRLLIISFHSLEDRIVKNQLKNGAEDGKGVIITKRPIIANIDEIKHNPRARSAKLRVFQKI
jgi:16S rRNA (cytosine1402-N4)-methyltransferase